MARRINIELDFAESFIGEDKDDLARAETYPAHAGGTAKIYFPATFAEQGYPIRLTIASRTGWKSLCLNIGKAQALAIAKGLLQAVNELRTGEAEDAEGA